MRRLIDIPTIKLGDSLGTQAVENSDDMDEDCLPDAQLEFVHQVYDE